MKPQMELSAKAGKGVQIFLASGKDAAPALKESKRAKAAVKDGKELCAIAQGEEVVYQLLIPALEASSVKREAQRNVGFRLLGFLKQEKAKEVNIILGDAPEESVVLLLEGFMLGAYQYLELRSNVEASAHGISTVRLVGKTFSKERLAALEAEIAAVYWTRDLVNKPYSHLDAMDFAKALTTMSETYGIKSEVLNKKKIESLKMGGLLAVNQGSVAPPTFTILEYKPKDAVNKKPIVLVGKGVVYDTGGLSLKPTPQSMDFMKSDMAGAAMMAGTLMNVAAQKLPVYVVVLIPATDNRPGGDAITPGDVITMYDGTTVEIKNTDAEGRLILADALSYAAKYKPQLVIDAATLTGAAVRAIGTYASCVMGTDEAALKVLEDAANHTFERVVSFPLWQEYRDELSSDVADMSNLGKGEGGQISAGKFLEHFTSYPWVHIDIAGPSFLPSASTYRPRGATGVGVRLLTDFIKRQIKA